MLGDLYGSYQLGGCTCLRVRKAARIISQIYDQHLAACDLTIGQFGILAYAYFMPENSVGDLARSAIMDPSTLTRNLKPMVDKGWLELIVGAQDRRQRIIKITETGKELLKKAAPYWEQAQKKVEVMLGEKGVGTFNSALDSALSQLHPL